MSTPCSPDAAASVEAAVQQDAQAEQAAVSGTPTSLFASALPAAYRPAFDRTVAVARDPGGGANSALVTFKSDGTVVPTAGSVTSGSTVPGAGGGLSTNATSDPGNINTGAPNTDNTTDASTGTSHTHGMQGYFRTTGGHTHTGAAHTRTVQPILSVTAPVRVSFNDVEYCL